MIKIPSVVFCLFLFCSCAKKDEPRPEAQEAQYEFQSIEYFLNEGDGMTVDSVPLLPSRTITNNASTTLSADIGVPQQYEISEFLNNEDFPFALQTGDSLKISVPVSVSGDQISTGEDKWGYRESVEEALPAATSDYHSTFDVTPYTKATIEIYAIWRKISAGYIATFKEQQTGKVLKVEGKWNGVQLKGFYTSGRWDDIQ